MSWALYTTIMVPQYNLNAIVTFYKSSIYIDPSNCKPRNIGQEHSEVQNGIKLYVDQMNLKGIVNRDRFLKGKCNSFRAANIAGRIPYFLQHKLIKKSEVKPNRGPIQLLDECDAEEERMMLEFNNNFTKNKTYYDPSLLGGVDLSLLGGDMQQEEISKQEDDENFNLFGVDV